MNGIRISVLALAILALPALTIQASAAGGGGGGSGGGGGGGTGGGGTGGGSSGGGGTHNAAPGPIVGAGLPALVVGSGVYWLVRRRKKKAIERKTQNRLLCSAATSTGWLNAERKINRP